MQKKRRSLLLKLCDSDKLLLCDVTRVLAERLKLFTDSLRESQLQCEPPAAHLLENVFHLLSCLECAAKKLREAEVASDVRVTLVRDVKGVLEESVLFVWRSHALLAHFVWHIVALLT